MTAAHEEVNNNIESGDLHSSCVGLVHRSKTSAATATDEEFSPAIAVSLTDFPDSGDEAASIRRRRQSVFDDVDLDTITLPESTHTLLFTEPICSVPFAIGIFIAGMSILCLLLALFSNLQNNDIPANVDVSVKTAQYSAIFIALLMEEEIPTGLYLLKRIPRQYFKATFPELSYHQFVFTNILRIVMGYLFLVNVLLTVLQASNVLGIFFDFIALNFIQQLDDIAFKLAQMSMLSTTLKEATTRRYFKTELKQTKLGRHGWASWFTIVVYLFNLCALMSGMVYVTVKQANGDYQCKSISVKLKEDVWENVIAQLPNQTDVKRVLVYSYFNGVYKQDGTRHDGRPVYVERSKFDGTEFDTSPPHPEVKVKIPAKIQYCKSINAWVFMHENIRKSKRHEESDCPWLLRSEPTDAYDIEDVTGSWQVWQGVIETTSVQISCDECNDNDDCNLNGICKKDGSCECYDDEVGKTFFGPHCEGILEDDCRTIAGETYNETYSVVEWDWTGKSQVWETYNRPIYMYDKGSSSFVDNELDKYSNATSILIYSGSRWFGTGQHNPNSTNKTDREWAVGYIKNYHAFWDDVFTNQTYSVSDPVPGTKFTPVGVDFYWIGERGEQFGPFGARYPFQKYNLTGHGHYRCIGGKSGALTNVNNATAGEKM